MSSLFDPAIIIYFRADDAIALKNASALIEEGQWVELKKGWRARIDNPHVQGMQRHVHLELRRHQVGVMNQDGSPSHGYDVDQIPKWVLQSLRRNGHIDEAAELFVERASYLGEPVPPDVIAEAIDSVERRRRLRRLLSTLH